MPLRARVITPVFLPMPQAVRAAIFDLDGTLADSAPDIAAALNRALRASGHAVLPVADVVAMVGHGAQRLCERALSASGVGADSAATERLLADFLAAYAAAPCVETRLYPGALETLQALRADGWRLAVCTNKPQALADPIVAALGIAPCFDAVVGGRAGLALKPAPDMLRLAIVEAGAQAGIKTAMRAVMIGDSAADCSAGQAAGVPVVLLAHGYSSAPVASLGADAMLDGFAGLTAALDSVLPLQTA
jgi:phosphoglycolate phosphatase